MTEIKILLENKEYESNAELLSQKLGIFVFGNENELSENDLVLRYGFNGVSLESGKLKLMGDFTKLSKRVKKGVVGSEILVKAAKNKGKTEGLTALDATAGLGEDSLLLAGAGFNVKMYEYDPIIAELLQDTVNRAKKDPFLSTIADRMQVIHANSIDAMNNYLNENDERLDAILLDPMFPERKKDALIGKKFQLLQMLESPCQGNLEEELLNAAMKANPKKIVIKRPLKGKELAGVKPHYSIVGKAIRYDCFALA